MTNTPTNTFRQKFFTVLRIGFTFLLLGRAFTLIDWENLQTALPTIEPIWLLLALGLLWLSNAISGLRWGNIMKTGKFDYPYIEYVRWYFSGGLINQGLPTTLGGDSYRAISAFNQFKTSHNLNPENHPNLKSSFYNVALDRSLGFAGNSILGAIGLGLGGYIFSEWVSITGWVLFFIMVLGAGLIAFLLYFQPTQHFYKKLLQKLQIPGVYSSTLAAWGWPQVVWQIPLAVFIHYLTLAAFWACLKACHVNAPVEALLIGIPAISILMILPISISGWGLREASLASILGLWHLNTSMVILSSLLYGVITLMTFLPGLFRLVVKKKST